MLEDLHIKDYYVYILRCSDGSLYTGYTDDIEDRLATHNSGKGAKYTRARLPVELVYFETLPTKSQALKREIAIKKLSRKGKEELVDRGFISKTEKRQEGEEKIKGNRVEKKGETGKKKNVKASEENRVKEKGKPEKGKRKWKGMDWKETVEPV